MTTRKDIINQLQKDLEKVIVSNGYKTDVVGVKLGALTPASFENQMPGIGFWPYADQLEEDLLGGTAKRLLKFIIYGFLDVDKELEDASRILDFVLDVEKFLYSSDNTLVDDTSIEESTFSVSSFIILFDIMYEQTDFI